MDSLVDSGISVLNALGQMFCVHGWRVFVQSSVLIGVLLVLDVLIRKRVRAVVRYSLWMLVFAKLLLPPTLSLPTGIGYYWPRSTTSFQASRKFVPPPVAAVRTPSAPVTAGTPDVVEVSEAGAGPSDAPSALVLPVVVRAAITWRALVFLAWLAGVAVLCICLTRRFQYVRKLVRESAPAPDPLQDVLLHCVAKLGLRRCPVLWLSNEAPGPVVCRLLSPVVLIPTALADEVSADRLRTVLVHELAHIKRADLWVNTIQTLLLVAHFYHPLLWLVNAIVRRLREQAVDETVLVALDADAESYSTTLIDLAEMTFHRPILGLRLIGIAESKKALEGRIRHMMTRPKPRTARVGVWGLLAVIATGAALLPMASAQSRGANEGAKSEPSLEVAKGPVDFKAVLPEGVTVELVGLCKDPAKPGSQQWWRPDGTAMDEPEHKGRLSHLPMNWPGFGYLLKFSALQKVTFRNQTQFGDLGVNPHSRMSASQMVVAAGQNGERRTGPPLPDQMDIQFDIAGGKWETYDDGSDSMRREVYGSMGRMGAGRRELCPRFVYFPDGKTVILSGLRPNLTSEGPKTLIEMTSTATNRDIQLQCLTSDGRTHKSHYAGLRTGGGLSHRASGFRVAMEDIERLVLKHRLYHRVTFKNVSLRPGTKTDVRVQAGTAGGGDLGPGVHDRKDLEARVRSATRLSDLGKALLIYANDHDDKLPDELSGLRDEIKVGMSWLLSNVTYLGKGVAVPRTHPATVLAYDKTLLEKGAGTNVLYLDSHVAFETVQTLEKLDIKPAPKSAERPQEDASIQARVTVLSQLKTVALAAIMCAGENDDAFPDSLKMLEPYLGRDETLRAWARENVQYMAKGLKAIGGREASRKLLAYCRPESGAADEVAVAFLDGHVEYVKGPRLKGLGIAITP